MFAHFPCDRILVGTQAEGQACLFSIECKEGLACEGYAIGAEGVCKAGSVVFSLPLTLSADAPESCAQLPFKVR